MISDKIRHIRPNGFDSSYLARWSIVRNSARVISTKGKDSQIFGYSGASNTRRYFQRIGNFESLEMGLPFIADRITLYLVTIVGSRMVKEKLNLYRSMSILQVII